MKHLFVILFYSTFYIVKLNAQFSISDSLNAFSINLLSTTSNKAPAENLALSPYTVWTLLTVLSEGAYGNTAKELDSVLFLSSDKKPVRDDYVNLTNGLTKQREGVQVDFMNAIFMSEVYPVKKEFENIVKQFYSANIRPIDFNNVDQACNIINDYVAKATNYRIQKIVDQKDITSSFLFLTTTIYFQGAWKSPFNRTSTKAEQFFDDHGSLLGNVQMMYRSGVYPYTKLREMGASAVELPYNGDVSMIVLLPYQGRSIQTLLSALQRTPFSNILKSLSNSEMMFVDEEVEVYLPRFSTMSDLNLRGVLSDMGLTEIFDSQKADLLGIAPHYLFVSNLLQKAEIVVNEEGTVAAAAAGASVTNKVTSPVFHANRPFLYFIVDKRTKTIIFSGKVSDPKDSK